MIWKVRTGVVSRTSRTGMLSTSHGEGPVRPTHLQKRSDVRAEADRRTVPGERRPVAGEGSLRAHGLVRACSCRASGQARAT